MSYDAHLNAPRLEPAAADGFGRKGILVIIMNLRSVVSSLLQLAMMQVGDAILLDRFAKIGRADTLDLRDF